jgi:carbamoyltransferase
MLEPALVLGERLAAGSQLVLAGGCALNVKVNELLRQRLGVANVWVPAAPNDAGLAIGSVMSYANQGSGTAFREALQRSSEMGVAFLGPHLWDRHALAGYAASQRATPATVDELAALLASGPVIIAVVQGRTEVGPRALGHRSLVAYPSLPDVKRRLNRLKVREWYRPVAPMVAADAVDEFFADGGIVSPFMSFAPRFSEWAETAFPAVAHLDGSARVQTVSTDTDPWLYALLHAVAAAAGYPILTNTSLNARGKPICNTIYETLRLLHDEEFLDFAFVDGVLFRDGLPPSAAPIRPAGAPT